MDGHTMQNIILFVVLSVPFIILLARFLKSLRCKNCKKFLDFHHSMHDPSLSDIFFPKRRLCFSCRHLKDHEP
jgi:hypothetical protein